MNEVKPVTIPHDVADTIEYMRRDSADATPLSNEGIAHVYVTESYVGPAAIKLRSIPFDTLMRALLDGYERGLTEEEEREKAIASLRDYYGFLREQEGIARIQTRGNPLEFMRAQNAIRITLNTFDIVIPGINDAEGGAA